MFHFSDSKSDFAHGDIRDRRILTPDDLRGTDSRASGRRGFLKQAALGGAMLAGGHWFHNKGAFAEELLQTPAMTEGPFYPDKLPLDTDNDLLIINDSISPAVGIVTYLTGRVLSATGTPVRNAFVEIWQVDNTASYLHSKGRNPSGNDGNFQGYGRFMTDGDGRYFFRTIKPVRYPVGSGFRAPHIHVGISRNGKRIFTTQLLVNGDPDNASDGVLRSVADPLLRETVLVDFKPLPNSKLGELTANFDIVMGRTLEELEDGTIRGGIGRPGR